MEESLAEVIEIGEKAWIITAWTDSEDEDLVRTCLMSWLASEIPSRLTTVGCECGKCPPYSAVEFRYPHTEKGRKLAIERLNAVGVQENTDRPIWSCEVTGSRTALKTYYRLDEALWHVSRRERLVSRFDRVLTKLSNLNDDNFESILVELEARLA